MPPNQPRIRVLCVDDHRIVRDGLTLIINREPDLEVVGSAASAAESVVAFRRQRPDVTLMDLQLPGISGLDAIRLIRGEDPQARIVVLTVCAGDEDIHRALKAGAATYLLKDTLSDDLIRVIREVSAGKALIGADIHARLAERSAQSALTRREIEVIDLVAQGMRNKEIAAALSLSVQTVQVHVKNILAKFNVSDRIAAVNIARRRGMIHLL